MRYSKTIRRMRAAAQSSKDALLAVTALAMVSSFFGVAVVALPAGVISAGYLSALEEEAGKNEDSCSGKNTIVLK